MNKIKALALLLWVALLCPFAKGQIDCTFDADQDSLVAQDSSYRWKYHQHANYVNWFRNNFNISQTYQQYGSGTSSLSCRRAVFILPVVFHVMYDPSVPATNVSDSVIEAQLEVMNAAFANARGSTHPKAVNTDIQFCLAQKKPDGTSFNGINRISYTGSHIKPTGAQKAGLAASAYYDNERYINIWVVKDIKDQNNASMNVGGYSNISYTTGIDGVVIRYDFMGSYTGCNSCFNSLSRGTVLVHEMGHFLGLFHTFQDSCLGGGDSATCYKKGDLCCDTRPCSQTYDCPTVSTQPDCANLPFYAGQDDNRKNYMSYADETCKDNFTQNQKEIMHAVLMGRRRGLVETKNTNSLALGCCNQSAWFNATNTFMCSPDTVKFEAVQQTGATYRWVIRLGTTTIKDTTLSTHTYQHFFNAQGRYDVTLTVDDSLGLLSFPRLGFVEYANCGNNLASTQGNWYFGKYAGLRFSTVGVVKDLTAYEAGPKTINTGEGCISYSDNNGNLLFYGGGDSLEKVPYFRLYKPSGVTHVQTNTSNPLKGHQSSTQGGIVIPLDNDTNKFFLVVTGGGISQYYSRPLSNIFRRVMGARYTLLDRTNPNLVVLPDTNMIITPPVGGSDADDGTLLSAEYITAIPRCGGGHWLILIDDGGGSTDKKLLVYKVDSTGITYHSTCNKVLENSYSGQMKASPNGNFIACPGYIFRFNNSTGTATFMKEYGVFDPLIYSDYYGVSFSPNSELLYVTLIDSTFSTRLVQYDLMSSNDSLSKQLINIPQTFNYFNSLQLAPDNKIYLSNDGVPQLGVINFPNNINTPLNPNNCGFTLGGPMLQNSNGEGGSCRAGLPNMIDALPPNSFTLGFTHVDSNCRTVKFFPNKYCDSVKKWYFGDGDSSSSQMPVHTYPANDSFTVRMVMWNGDSAVQKIKIGLDTPNINGTSFVICDTTALYSYSISNRQDNLYYTWSVTNGTLSGIDSLNVIADVFWSGTNNALIVQADDRRTGCRAYDTLVITRGATPQSDSLWTNTPPCTKGSSFVLKSHTLPNASYVWYKSTDSVNWTVISGQTADTLTDTITTDSIYYKRLISITGCSAFSVVKKVVPQVFIRRQPENCAACPGGWREFSIAIATAPGVTVTPIWNYQLKGSSQWSALFYIGDTMRDYPTTIAFDSAKYRCSFNTSCGTTISDTAYVIIEKTPTVTSHPQSQTRNEEDSAVFTVASTATKPSYTWFYSYDNGTTWDSIAGEHNDTLIVRNLSMCQNQYQYKALAGTHCSGLETYSNAATLVVTQTRFADLWWRDNLWDGGVEPTIDSNGIWTSPDIWVRKTADGDTNHQNPNYDTASSNYIYYRIKNRGVDTSKAAELYIYWTKLAMGERWPIDWTTNSSNVYVNPCVGTIYYNNTYAMGGEVNTTPISIPPIAPGGTHIEKVAWNPPNPYWYGTRQRVFGNIYVNIIPDSVDVCLLGRIVTCERDSFGLTRKEIQRIKPNIYHNNNIVTRNLKLTNINRIHRKSTTWVGIRNTDDVTPCSDIRMPAHATFPAAGEVFMHLNDVLLTSWQSTGYVGSGFTMIDSNTLRVTPYQTFVMSNVCLTGDEYAQIGVEFVMDSTYVLTTPETYQFSIGQYAVGTTNILGGANFDVTLTTEGQDSVEHIDSLDFVIAPNPTSGSTINVGITTNFTTSSAVLYIYDNWGYSMISPMGLGTLTEGANSRTVNISGLSAGTYTMVIAANGVNYSRTFIVLNE